MLQLGNSILSSKIIINYNDKKRSNKYTDRRAAA